MSRHLLIIYPHWPPSNLAGMHRARLVANGARDCNWEVTVITVSPNHYEEPLDQEMNLLIRSGIEVIQTSATSVLKFAGYRIIGDIGLRGYRALKEAAEHWLQLHHTDFIWFPIPSWYTPLMGPGLSQKFNTPYGVDYIDPWVYQLTVHEPMFSRAWWTRQLALILEPRAIRKASIVSGVADEYFRPAIHRTFKRGNGPLTVSFPYGFDPEDHIQEPKSISCPFNPNEGRYILYAGAFLPHSESFARYLFKAIAQLHHSGIWPQDLRLQFVGTGIRPGPTVHTLAQEYGLGDIVKEHPDRIPFLSVQHLLRQAYASLVLGSTESHYTASKTFQCLLAGNPVVSILHKDSSALSFIKRCNAEQYSCGWHESHLDIQGEIIKCLSDLLNGQSHPWNPNLEPLQSHTARHGTNKLLNAIESLQ